MVQGLLGKGIHRTSQKSDDNLSKDGAKPGAPSLSRDIAPQQNQETSTGQQASVVKPAEPALKAEQRTEPVTPPVEPPTDTTSVKQMVPNLESLEIRDFELSAIGDLAPLLGRSPRALKRFVNLYRLIKAGLTAAEHNAFVHREEGVIADFQATLFLLAIDTGLPRVSRVVFDTLLEMKEVGEVGVKQFLEKVGKHPSAKTADWNTLNDWIGALNGREKFDQGMAVIADWVPRVARYSFQASHIEGIREFPTHVPETLSSVEQ